MTTLTIPPEGLPTSLFPSVRLVPVLPKQDGDDVTPVTPGAGMQHPNDTACVVGFSLKTLAGRRPQLVVTTSVLQFGKERA